MAVPLSDTARLRRVFEIELGRGCDNGAVIGGLDRMFIQMAEDAVLPPRHPLQARIHTLPAGGYRSLPPEERESWLRGTIRALGEPAPPHIIDFTRRQRESEPRPSSEPRLARSGRDRTLTNPQEPPPPSPPSISTLELKSPVTRLPLVGKSAATK